MTYGSDGRLYVSSSSSSEVLRFDGMTGASMGVFVTAGSGSLDFPVGLQFMSAIPEPSSLALGGLLLAGAGLGWKRRRQTMGKKNLRKV